MSLLKKTLVVLSLMWAVSATAATNLCYNGNFDSPKGALDGWNVNYEWLGNSFFMKNHEHCSVLPMFQGKKNVLSAAFPHQGRVESKLFPVEKGARYKCTLDLNSPSVRFYFKAYKWEPGVAPHDDPKLSEMREVYRSENFTGGSGGGWKTISFYMPMEEISELAYDHYKYARYATVYMTRYRGGFHVANVRVEKLPGTYKVRKSTETPSTPTIKGTLPKLPPLKGAPKPGAVEDFNE